MLNAIMQCRYAEWHYVDCRYAGCRGDRRPSPTCQITVPQCLALSSNIRQRPNTLAYAARVSSKNQ